MLCLYFLEIVSVLGFSWETKPNPFQQAKREPGVALHKFNRYFICVGKHTPKYLVSHYDELPETGYWRLGRFITIIVVISVVLIVRQEDPDKIQDARGLLKSIGLQTGQLE